jgi:integrase/recombinase XerC
MALSTPQLIQSFIDYLKFEKRYSIHTLTSYGKDLQLFFEYVSARFGETPIKEINYQYIRSWLAELKDSGLKAKSINRRISTLRSFFKHLLKEEVIEISPVAKVIAPKSGKRLPVFVNEDDTRLLLKSLEHSSEDWKSLNARMLITIFYSTGMRLSELINLREKQVDSSRLQIKVLGKGNKERIIPVNSGIIQMIRDYQQLKKKEFERSDDVLLVSEKGKKLYPKYVWLLVNQYLAGSTTLDKKSPHVLRHTFATHLMNNGADLNAVKELLGHSSLAATQVYTHNTIKKLKNVHNKAHPKA